jgi:hypothetical protein
LTLELAAKRHTAFREQAQSRLEEAGAPLVPDTQAFLAEVTAAASQLQSSPAAKVGDQSLGGPACFGYFLTQWRETQLNALRCRAIDWGRRVTIPRRTFLPVPSLANRVDDAQYSAFCDQLVQGLAAIIAADAQRAGSSEASALYAAYLQVLGKEMPRMADQRLVAAVQQSLDTLIAKSPELGEQVTAYRAATDELLRWRERVAAEEVAAHDASFPPSSEVLTKAFTRRTDYDGLVSQNQTAFSEARLLAPAPEVLGGAVGQIVDQPLRLGRIASLPGGKLGVAVYNNRHYATLAMPQIPDAVDSLKRDLLVAEQTPPLSLAAAIAVASAEQGDLVAVGGTTQAVYVEGLIPRFATLPAAALPMSPLGPLPSEPKESGLLSHVVIRLQLTPDWFRHRYFFVPATETAATGGAE